MFTSGNSAQAPKSAYAAAPTINAAIVAMARALLSEASRIGVQVNSVLPGPVLTNRRRTDMEKYAARAENPENSTGNCTSFAGGIGMPSSTTTIFDSLPNSVTSAFPRSR